MKYNQLIAALCCIVTSACSSTTMTVRQYEPSSGQLVTKIYSKYYDAGDWLVPNYLGATVVADHMKRRIPVLYGAQRFLGALGPSDSKARAKITVYLWNFNEEFYTIKNIELSSRGQALRAGSMPIVARSKERTRVDLGVIDIYDGGKEIPVVATYTVNGKRIKQSLNLLRRTKDENMRFYGEQGKLPYPWHARADELKY